VALDCERLLAEAKPVRVELVRRGLTAVGCGEKGIAQEHYEKMLELAEQSAGGRRVEMPGGFVARREYGNVILEKGPRASQSSKSRIEQTRRAGTATSRQVQEQGVEAAIPGKTIFGGCVIETKILQREEGKMDSCFHRDDRGVEKYIERFDLDRVKLPVVVRSRRDGDRFDPLGLAATKKVGKFLSDARVPSDVRRKVLVVEDCEKVIWVWPIRMSGQAKVTDRTRKILQIEITDAPSAGQRKEVER
jgi:tRNA(Ile)-lysidine synthase